jgi:hypothetical protein
MADPALLELLELALGSLLLLLLLGAAPGRAVLLPL